MFDLWQALVTMAMDALPFAESQAMREWLAAWGWLALVFVAPPLLPLLLTLFNIAFWPRGTLNAPSSGARLFVLIPARNEEARIEACVRAAFAAGTPSATPHAVIVCDDHSTDRTAAVLDGLSAEFPALRVIRGAPLPKGWVGKPHACHQLAQAARALGAGPTDRLVFIDADTVLKPGAFARLESIFAARGAGLVTAVPQQITVTFFERLVLPLLHLTYTSWFPLPLVWLSSDTRFLAANGQVLAVTVAAYDKAGGYGAKSVRRALVDDMALCRTVKETGTRVVFADGFDIATCRMYTSASQVWDGFSKNIFEGLGRKVPALVMVNLLYSLSFIAPWVAAAVLYVAGHPALPVALVGVGINVAHRLVLFSRYRQPSEGILLHPLAVLALLAISINSYLWSARGSVVWSGRAYAPRDLAP